MSGDSRAWQLTFNYPFRPILNLLGLNCYVSTIPSNREPVHHKEEAELRKREGGGEKERKK